MRDLLQATSRKKYDVIPPFLYSTLDPQSFIRQEDFRSEPSLFAEDEDSTPSLVDSVETNSIRPSNRMTVQSTHDEGVENRAAPTEPSYYSFADQGLYRTPSPPTYVPGDYHDISLPDSPSASMVTENNTQPDHMTSDTEKKLPFSIESLIGDAVHDTVEASPYLDSAPAYVVSHVPSVFSTFPPKPSEYQKQPVYDREMFLQARSSHANAISSSVYWCHYCAKFCSSAASAMEHRYAHASSGVRCDLRTAIFKQHGYVTVHENTGFLDRIKCGLCQKIVCGRYFVKHVRVHNGHHCGMCSREFATKSRLRDHLHEHSGEVPYACSECPRRFSSRVQLAQHVRSHRNFRSFQCSVCEKRFNSKHACTVHERIHSGNNPYRCEVVNCTRSFPQKVQLNLHMNTHI